jgi:2-phospho-L-lactate guanylyltransferase
MAPEIPLRTVVLVPLKNFSDAKSRLREVLTAHDVETLTRELARAVLEAVKPYETLVVCDDDDVAAFAVQCGVEVVRTAERSLNGAVSEAYRSLAEYDQATIVHADLRAPEGLGGYQPGPGITIVTDHRGTGTNVLSLPTGLDFHFCYGPGSAQLHEREAQRLGVACEVTTNSPWQFDVDDPDDLESSPDSI